MRDTNLPTLSVVIPVYNVSKYVLEAIDSVINQTITPFEVIIVDDGSTDNSGELVEQYYSEIQYVKIIHTHNQGLGEARNVGTRAALGEYIYYFDSDDVLQLYLIEDFYNALKSNGELDIFAFSAESFLDGADKEMVAPQNKLPKYLRVHETLFSSGGEAFIEMSRTGTFYPNAWLYIFRRKFFTDFNITFKSIIHEDEEFTPRLFLHAGKTFITRKCFFKRRVRAGSIMQSSRSEKNIIGYIESINALEVLLASHDGEIKKYLRARLIENILNILVIQKSNNIVLTTQTSQRVRALLKKYKTFYIFLAQHNFFVYRVVKFVMRKFGCK
ncbi:MULTISPECIES: glycosyltransferase family 2 protein [Klebsiella]|uniref:glycosyltransferase family 2 protein n=1 Tax=Klebsiella TaxID=570 RepID=UPI0002976DD8|nr:MULTISPECIES: glycosyltransferase [Klebsiella]ARI09492.1 capsular biosynthesis protein [Klebsiella sp. M5al]EKP25147.1 capsular polysaccharide biosynthesis protein [Klebsiella michiganensis]KZT46668.1 capsular biosynthesis protein [Klebsiella michiganensis]MBZ0041712.1 glycosyltransferase [Klebsiella grimontii]